MVAAILVTGLIAALVQFGLHYFPWQLALRREMPRLGAYVGGVLGFGLPLTILLLLLFFDNGEKAYLISLAAFWIVVAFSGAAVIIAYGLDRLLIRLARESEFKELLEEKKK